MTDNDVLQDDSRSTSPVIELRPPVLKTKTQTFTNLSKPFTPANTASGSRASSPEGDSGREDESDSSDDSFGSQIPHQIDAPVLHLNRNRSKKIDVEQTPKATRSHHTNESIDVPSASEQKTTTWGSPFDVASDRKALVRPTPKLREPLDESPLTRKSFKPSTPSRSTHYDVEIESPSRGLPTRHHRSIWSDSTITQADLDSVASRIQDSPRDRMLAALAQGAIPRFGRSNQANDDKRAGSESPSRKADPEKALPAPPAPIARTTSDAPVPPTTSTSTNTNTTLSSPSKRQAGGLVKMKKRVQWRNRTCLISLPPENYKYPVKFLTAEEVRARLDYWIQRGYNVNGFDIGDDSPSSPSNSQEQDDKSASQSGQSASIFPSSEDILSGLASRSFTVRIPDRAAWDRYMDEVREAKLRALGVGLPGDEEEDILPALPPSRTLSRVSHTSHMSLASPFPRLNSAGREFSRPASHFSNPSLISPPPGFHFPRQSVAFPQGVNVNMNAQSPGLPMMQRPGPTSPFAPLAGLPVQRGSPSIQGLSEKERPVTPQNASARTARFANQLGIVSPRPQHRQNLSENLTREVDAAEEKQIRQETPNEPTLTKASEPVEDEASKVGAEEQDQTEVLKNGNSDDAEIQRAENADLAFSPPRTPELEEQVQEQTAEPTPKAAPQPVSGPTTSKPLISTTKNLNATAPEFRFDPSKSFVPSGMFSFTSGALAQGTIAAPSTNPLPPAQQPQIISHKATPSLSSLSAPKLNVAAPAFVPGQAFQLPTAESRDFSFESSMALPSLRAQLARSGPVPEYGSGSNSSLPMSRVVSGMSSTLGATSTSTTTTSPNLPGNSIFGTLDFDELMKPPKGNAAIPIVKPGSRASVRTTRRPSSRFERGSVRSAADQQNESDSDSAAESFGMENEEEEDETGRLAQSGRSKRARVGADDGDDEPRFESMPVEVEEAAARPRSKGSAAVKPVFETEPKTEDSARAEDGLLPGVPAKEASKEERSQEEPQAITDDLIDLKEPEKIEVESSAPPFVQPIGDIAPIKAKPGLAASRWSVGPAEPVEQVKEEIRPANDAEPKELPVRPVATEVKKVEEPEEIPAKTVVEEPKQIDEPAAPIKHVEPEVQEKSIESSEPLKFEQPTPVEEVALEYPLVDVAVNEDSPEQVAEPKDVPEQMVEPKDTSEQAVEPKKSAQEILKDRISEVVHDNEKVREAAAPEAKSSVLSAAAKPFAFNPSANDFVVQPVVPSQPAPSEPVVEAPQPFPSEPVVEAAKPAPREPIKQPATGGLAGSKYALAVPEQQIETSNAKESLAGLLPSPSYFSPGLSSSNQQRDVEPEARSTKENAARTVPENPTFEEIDAVIQQMNVDSDDAPPRSLPRLSMVEAPAQHQDYEISPYNASDVHRGLSEEGVVSPVTESASSNAIVATASRAADLGQPFQYLPHTSLTRSSTASEQAAFVQDNARYSPSYKGKRDIHLSKSPVRRLQRQRSASISDWNSFVDSADEAKLNHHLRQGRFSVSENIQSGAVTAQLRSLEDKLAFITTALRQIAPQQRRSRPPRQRPHRASKTQESDADDEDEETLPLRQHSSARSYRIPSSGEGRSESEPLAGQAETMAAAMVQIKDLLAENQRNQAAEIQALKSELNKTKAVVNETIETPEDESSAMEQLNEQVAELQTQLAISEARLKAESEARQAAEALVDASGSIKSPILEMQSLKQNLVDVKKHLHSALLERDEAREHSADMEDSQAMLQKEFVDLESRFVNLETKNTALEVTLDEYRLSHEQWRKDINDAATDNASLQNTIHILQREIEEGMESKRAFKQRFDNLQEQLSNAARTIAKEQSLSRQREEEGRLKHEMNNARLEAEARTREKLEQEIDRLEQQEKEFMRTRFMSDQVRSDNATLTKTITDLRVKHQEAQDRLTVHDRELEDVRERSTMEVQRLRLANATDMDNIRQQHQIVRDNLEAVVKRTETQLEQVKSDAHASKSRYQGMLDEAAESKNAALLQAAESRESAMQEHYRFHERALDETKAAHDSHVSQLKSTHEEALTVLRSLHKESLEELQKRHDEVITIATGRHKETIEASKAEQARAISIVKEDFSRSMTTFTEEKRLNDQQLQNQLTAAQERANFEAEKCKALEQRLELAQAANQAAVEAARSARESAALVRTSSTARSTHPRSSLPSMPMMTDSELPEKISPQALRETIITLQEQLHARESKIESLEAELAQVDKTAPARLAERDIEVAWLRDMLSLRMDDLQEVIETLSSESYNKDVVRDAIIRLRANLEMEQQERERAIQVAQASGRPLVSAQNLTIPSLSDLAASPRSIPLVAAAALTNWRKAQTPFGSLGEIANGVTEAAVSATASASERFSNSRFVSSTHSSNSVHSTPSRGSPAPSALSGLLTPPASNLSARLKPSSTISARTAPSSRPSFTGIVEPSVDSRSRPIHRPLAGYATPRRTTTSPILSSPTAEAVTRSSDRLKVEKRAKNPLEELPPVAAGNEGHEILSNGDYDDDAKAT